MTAEEQALPKKETSSNITLFKVSNLGDTPELVWADTEERAISRLYTYLYKSAGSSPGSKENAKAVPVDVRFVLKGYRMDDVCRFESLPLADDIRAALMESEAPSGYYVLCCRSDTSSVPYNEMAFDWTAPSIGHLDKPDGAINRWSRGIAI